MSRHDYSLLATTHNGPTAIEATPSKSDTERHGRGSLSEKARYDKGFARSQHEAAQGGPWTIPDGFGREGRLFDYAHRQH